MFPFLHLIDPRTGPPPDSCARMRLSLACLARHTVKADFLCFVYREVRHQSADNNTNTATWLTLMKKDKCSLSFSPSLSP